MSPNSRLSSSQSSNRQGKGKLRVRKASPVGVLISRKRCCSRIYFGVSHILGCGHNCSSEGPPPHWLCSSLYSKTSGAASSPCPYKSGSKRETEHGRHRYMYMCMCECLGMCVCFMTRNWCRWWGAGPAGLATGSTGHNAGVG